MPSPAGYELPAIETLGFQQVDLAANGVCPGMSGAASRFQDFIGRLPQYHEARDFPAIRGVSYLSVHLRFGTISVRQLVAHALQVGGEGGMTWLSELVWRDFYFMILDRFPHVVDQSFRSEFDALVWDEWPEGLQAWQAGRTGYPLVDAAMRQLEHSGYMHNRLRMVTASFLTKDLGIDWRAGERWFADKLLDYDLAANNGGWQWAASTGCDAQPWFRIFNPVRQSENSIRKAASFGVTSPSLQPFRISGFMPHGVCRRATRFRAGCGSDGIIRRRSSNMTRPGAVPWHATKRQRPDSRAIPPSAASWHGCIHQPVAEVHLPGKACQGSC